jgi:hypothetical protein
MITIEIQVGPDLVGEAVEWCVYFNPLNLIGVE